MHIIELNIQNCNIIQALEICPETGKPIVITGANAAGKSSAINAIFAALTNSGLTDPIRHGADKCIIRLELGDGNVVSYSVKRTYTAKGAYLEVRDSEDRQVPSPQDFLNKLAGKLLFDPLEFSRLRPREQAETLKVICGLDFSDLETQRKDAYERRTVANVQAGKLEARFKGVPRPSDDVTDECRSVSAIVDEIDALNLRAKTLTDMHEQVQAHRRIVTTTENEIARLEKLLADTRSTLVSAKEGLSKASEATEKAEADGVPSQDIPAELAKRRDALQNVETFNVAVRAKAEWRRLKDEWNAATKEAETLDSTIKKIDAERANRLRNANIPVSGMELTGEGVLVNDVPFQQLSTGEQIKVSAALAMSQNPKLRVMLMREGSLLDDGNLAVLTELCAERDFQLWLEKVSAEPISDSFHIVEGQLTEAAS